MIEEAERHKGPKKDLCVKYGIAPPTLPIFLKNKQSHREAGMFSGKQRKMRSSCNKTIDKALFLAADQDDVSIQKPPVVNFRKA